jgi:hypothetical protein
MGGRLAEGTQESGAKRRPADWNILAQGHKGAEEGISEIFGILLRYTDALNEVLREICECVGLPPFMNDQVDGFLKTS